MQRILDSIGAPAYVRNNRLDLLGVNRLGRALLCDLYTHDASRPNLARYLFLDPRSQDFYVDWAAVAKDVVSALRIEAGRNPYDRGLTDLVGELSTRSEEFRTWWASHTVGSGPPVPLQLGERRSHRRVPRGQLSWRDPGSSHRRREGTAAGPRREDPHEDGR